MSGSMVACLLRRQTAGVILTAGLVSGLACAKNETVVPVTAPPTSSKSPSATLSPDLQRQFEEDRVRARGSSIPAGRATTTAPVLDGDGNPQRAISGDPFGVGVLPPRERDPSCDVLAGLAALVRVEEDESTDLRSADRVRGPIEDNEYLSFVMRSVPVDVAPLVRAWIDTLKRWVDEPTNAARWVERRQAMAAVGEWYRDRC